MLFLGAGASVPLGIQDLSGITSLIRNRASENLLQIIDRIEEILGRESTILTNFRFDLEVLYTIIDGLGNKNLILNDLGPFAVMMNNLLFDNEEFNNLFNRQDINSIFQEFKQLVNEVLPEAINAYQVDNTHRNRGRTLYDQLFHLRLLTDIKNYNGNKIINTCFNVVTTLNYDRVLEIYDRDPSRTEIAPQFFARRGFRNEGGEFQLDLDNIRNGTIDIEYIKLHGSIDWWKSDENTIIISNTAENPYIHLTERSIIYPIYEKHISREPFFTLYQYFRRKILKEDIVIVIGYSFRDPSINNAFIDWLQNSQSSRLIIVAKRTNQVGIRRIFGRLINRIQFIETYFGDDVFIENLEDHLINPRSTIFINT